MFGIISGFHLKQNLARKLIIHILLFSSLITLLATGIQLYFDYTRDVSLIEDRMKQIKASYLESVAKSLWDTNFELLKIQLEGIVKLPDMECVKIIKDGQTIASAGGLGSEKVMIRDFPIVYFQWEVKNHLGTLHVTASLDRIYHRMIDRIIIILITQTIKTFLVSLFIFFLFYALIGRHLVKMGRDAASLDMENLDEAMTLNRLSNPAKPDELDALVSAINSMRIKLKEYLDKTREMNRSLSQTNESLQFEITERRRAEAALKDSEERFRGIAEAAVDSIFCKDRNSRYTFVNPAMANIFGCSPSDLIGLRPEDLFDPESAAVVNEVDQRTFSGRTVNAVRSVQINGQQMIFHTIQTPLYDSIGRINEICGIVRNITELKQAEETIRHQDEQFRIIFDMALDMICIADIETATFTKINPAFTRILGYTERELLNRSFLEFIHPDDMKPTIAILEEELKKGFKVLSFENRYLCKDGSYRWLNWTSHPNPEKGITFGIAHDVTDRKEMERILKQSEEKYRTLNESINIGIFMTALDGTILHANPAMVEMAGYKGAADILRIRAQSLYADVSDRDRFIRELRENGFVKNMEVYCFKKDKTPYWVLVSAVLLKDEAGKPMSILGSSQDITDRKRVEYALQDSEEKYRSLYSEMNEGVCLHELIFNDAGNPTDYRIIDVNPAYEAITGLKKENVLGMAASKLYGAGEPPYFNIYVDVALSGNSTAFETYFPPMDKYFSISVFSPGKNKFATVFTDVTYRKRSEEHINILNQELTEKNKELEQIVYAASHDLRSPLVNIQGFTRELQYSFHEVVKLISETSDVESIRENLNSRIRKDVEDAFDFISKSTAKMDSLLSGLLRLSRLGRSALTIKRIHMNGLISDIVKTFEYRIQQAGITVEWEDLPDCYGDESMINQVFSNLIDNAVKFMDSGRPGRICVSGVVKNAQTVYCVQDNGIGIALEYHKKIFALFHRLDPKISGEGLGLSIIRKIVERHGGKIWVESEPGAGTKFYLSFENTERKGVNE